MYIPEIKIDFEYAKGVLLDFLNLPLYSTDELFLKFRNSLDSYIFKSDITDSEIRFLYHRGVRKNKVLLVAHADTYFTEKRGYLPIKHKLIEFPDKTIISDDPERGLGADDRAGCAILYILKDMGHSILILDSEEYSKLSAQWLIANFPRIASDINSHQFMIELDLEGDTFYKTYDVGSLEFKTYIESEFEYTSKEISKFTYKGTDIAELAKEICGVNLSVGYQNHHTADECINIKYWFNTFVKLYEFLQKTDIPKFELKMEHIGYELD